MRHPIRVLVVLLIGCFVAMAEPIPSRPEASVASPVSPNGHLPIKRVVLYKNGVGYFEHSGRIRGNQDLTIDFTSSQLDDVLKSLTVMDTGDGRVTAVRYNSIAPLDERLRSLRIPLGQQVTRADFLNALRGARVEIRSGSATATGKLLSVETRKKQTAKGDELVQVTECTLMTESGELRSFELTPGTTVRLAERDLNEEVSRYLDLLGSSRARDLRRMIISTSGAGDRDLVVSYISEVPIWKSTYRIILPTQPGAKPLLQGWAIVDNTIGEDWKNVQLSLISGSPQSFIEKISQPYYARRPVVALPETAMLTPQTFEGTMDRVEMFAKLNTAPAPANATGGAIGGPLTHSGQNTFGAGPGHGGGIGGGTYKVGSLNPSDSVSVTGEGLPAVSTATLANTIEPQANSKDLGDLFEYNLKQAITIGKDQSALVPILQEHIEADKVTLWSEDSGRPLRALWLKNTSGLTLDGGTFNIVEGDTFAGEGLLEVIKPSERRLVSYAADPAVRVTSEQEGDATQLATHIKLYKGVMKITRERRMKEIYTIHNADTTPRDVVIQHPAQEEWKLADDSKPEESSASYHRFRVKLDPGATQKLAVQEIHPEETQFLLANLNSEQVLLWSSEKIIKPETEQAFNEVLKRREQVSLLDSQMHSRQQEIDSITADQARVRENMKALKGSAEEKSLLQRYAQQLNSQEDRLQQLRTEVADLRQQHSKVNDNFTSYLMSLSLDETVR